MNKPSPVPTPTPRCLNERSGTRRRAAFTLAELLIVISILAVLGGLALSVIRGARYDANASRTATQLTQIERFLNERLEEYAVRVLPFRLASLQIVVPPPRQLQPVEIGRLRNRMLIEYITSEMPCDPSQVTLLSGSPPPWVNFVSQHFENDFGSVVDTAGNSLVDLMRIEPTVPPQFRVNPPSLLMRMTRRLTVEPPSNVINDAYCAECLYEILNSHNDLYSSGLDALFADEIGDTDGDGRMEVLDAWGEPVIFYVTLDPIPPGAGVRLSDNGGVPPVTLLNGYTAGDALLNIADDEGPAAVKFYLKSRNILDR